MSEQSPRGTVRRGRGGRRAFSEKAATITVLDLGYPLVTSASGGRFVVRDDGEAYDHHEVLWRYPNLTLTWRMSLTNSYGFDLQGDPRPRTRLGVYYHGANGTFDADYLGASTLVPEGDALKDKPAPPKSTLPSPGQEREWLDCIKSRQQRSCSVFHHAEVDVPIVLSLLSVQLGRSIRFDPEGERIVGDDEAARRASAGDRSSATERTWLFQGFSSVLVSERS